MNKHRTKDCHKFEICNKLITQGAHGSSSDLYAKRGVGTLKLILNPTEYTSTDIVGVSVNGNRTDRISFNAVLIEAAIDAGVTFVTDNYLNTHRKYNVGERELARFLEFHEYITTSSDEYRSIWKPAVFC